MVPRGSLGFPDAFPFKQVEEALRQVFVRHWSEDNGRAHCHGNSRACSSSVRYCRPSTILAQLTFVPNLSADPGQTGQLTLEPAVLSFMVNR
jgi:hypothetical protein